MKPIKYHIRLPWFMTAGEIYDWDSLYSQEGIGLAKDKLKGQVRCKVVEIGDKQGYKYFSTVGILQDFITEYPDSQQEIRKGKWLLIFPRSIFEIKKPKNLRTQQKSKVQHETYTPKEYPPTLF